MFNRKLQISFVKDDKKTQTTPDTVKTPVDYVAVVTELGKKAVIATCVIIVTFAVATTAGQVTVNALDPSKKL